MSVLPRALLVSFPEPGHLRPFTLVARRLVAAGVQVALFTHTDVSERLEHAGLNVPTFTVEGLGQPARATRSTDFTALLAKRAWAQLWYRRVLLDLVPAQVKSLGPAIEQFRPDVIVTDSIGYAGAIAAERHRLPWAGLSTQLLNAVPNDWTSPLSQALDEQRFDREQLFRDHGVEISVRNGEAISPWLNVLFSCEELTPRAWSNNSHSFYVGAPLSTIPSAEDAGFDWSRVQPQRPLIYVAAGSQLSFQPRTLLPMLRGFASLDAQVVLSAKDTLTEELAAQLPENVAALRWVPQAALLKRTQLMVSHGGVNSFLEALAEGVPLIVTPLGHEQPLQARLVEEAGLGVHLAPDALTEEKAAAAASQLLSADSPRRTRLAVVRQALQRRDASMTIANLVQRLATDRRPLRFDDSTDLQVGAP